MNQLEKDLPWLWKAERELTEEEKAQRDEFRAETTDLFKDLDSADEPDHARYHETTETDMVCPMRLKANLT